MIAAADHSVASPVHALPAAVKLVALGACGTGLMFVDTWWAMVPAMLGVLAAYALARIPHQRLLGQLKPLAWLLVPLFFIQSWLLSWQDAAFVILRLVSLVLLASLVTMTTRTEDMTTVLEKAFSPLARFGADPARIGLAFSLALRFIPVIGQLASEIRDAQRARGLGRNPLALFQPLVVRVLRTADEVADAIDARSFGGEDPEESAAAPDHQDS